LTIDKTVTLKEMGSLYESVLSEPTDRQFIFSKLLGSIAYCEKLGAKGWSVTQLSNGFRLNVGQVEAMTCQFMFLRADDSGLADDRWLVTLRLLLAGADCLERIQLSEGVARIVEMSYASVGHPHWCYEGNFYAGENGVPEGARTTIAGHLDALRDNHHEFLKYACHTPTGKLRQQSNFARAHCQSLYDYAVSMVGGSAASQINSSHSEVTSGQLTDISALERVRIEKAAADSGFELAPVWNDNGATLRSVQFPESVKVVWLGGQTFMVSASNPDVLPEGLTLPLFSGLHKLSTMRISCLAAGPRSSVAQTSWD